jgi:hypothetical protein
VHISIPILVHAINKYITVVGVHCYFSEYFNLGSVMKLCGFANGGRK